MEPNQQPRMKIDISSAPWTECCGGPQMFEISYMFKRVSALISPSGQEEHVPIEVITCKKCGKVPEFMWKKVPDLPEDMKAGA
jgi:hypothetical protein